MRIMRFPLKNPFINKCIHCVTHPAHMIGSNRSKINLAKVETLNNKVTELEFVCILGVFLSQINFGITDSSSSQVLSRRSTNPAICLMVAYGVSVKGE